MCLSIHTYFSHMCAYILTGWNALPPLRQGELTERVEMMINRDILRIGRDCRQRARELVRYTSRHNLKK